MTWHPIPMPMHEKLKCARLAVRLTQKDAGRLARISDKSISSWETGARADTIKLGQLTLLLAVYEMTLAEFFAWVPTPEEREALDWPAQPIFWRRVS